LSAGRVSTATQMRYTLAFLRQGFQRRPLPDAMTSVGVNEDRPFAPCDCLVSIKADALPWRRCLDTRAVGTAGRRSRQATLTLAIPLAQGLHDASPDPLTPPTANSAINRVGIADIRGQHVSLAPSFVDVEDAIKDAAEVHGLAPRSVGAPCGLGSRGCRTSHWASLASVG
jgi:hypothetical protein